MRTRIRSHFLFAPGYYFNSKYFQKFRLLPEGEGLGLWLKANVDVYFKLYVFNVTNKEAFVEGREKLRLEEVGPYYYRYEARNCQRRRLSSWQNWNFTFLNILFCRLTVEQKNPKFNKEEGTLTTTAETKYEWAPEMNNRSQEDNFTLPNIPLLVRKFNVLIIINHYQNASSTTLPPPPHPPKNLLNLFFKSM